MSHVLLTTTVNIAASRTSSVLVRRGKGFRIPEGFFYNKEAFDALFGDELQVQFQEPFRIIRMTLINS